MAKLDRLERLTNLVLVLLDTKRPLTLVQITDRVPGYPLAEGHGAVRQAFERDKRTLREEGIRISVETVETSARQEPGYRIKPDDYYLADLGLSADEQVALNLAVAGVHLDDVSGREALLKLGFLDRVEPAPLTWLPTLPALPVLHEAIRHRATVSFQYRSLVRQVDPYGLLFRAGSWYLIGWDHRRSAVRTFRVERMESQPVAGDQGSFRLPEDLDLAAQVTTAPWRTGEGEPLRAKVLIDSLMAPSVVAELGDEAVSEKREDGSVVVGMEVTSEPAFRSWLLGLLDHAVVLSPAPLRQGIIDWLEAIATSTGEIDVGPGYRVSVDSDVSTQGAPADAKT